MTENFNKTETIVANYMENSVSKTKQPIQRLFLLGIMAGAFIAFGASSSSVAMHGVADIGLARTIAGCIFPVGLMMIVFVGGELFTGDCLMFMGMLDRRYSCLMMIKVLVIVYISNLVGAMGIAWLVNFSGQLNYSDSALAAFTIKVAMGKANISFGTAFVSGILCNILVCAAVIMANAAKDIAGKVWAIFFPILAFVIGGYEHCVANMYYIPAGIFASKNAVYAQKAMELYGYSVEQMKSLNWANMFIKNQIPVTLGNIVGGMVCVGLVLYVLYGMKEKKNNEKVAI